jgi:hypothetical protein
MMSISARAAGVVMAAMFGALPAAAQVPGLPVYNQGVPRGIGLYGDIGFPGNDAGGGTAYGVTGRAGFGLLGVTAILSTYNPDGPGDGKVSVGATGNLRLFGGPLVPLSVTLQGGAGYQTIDGGALGGSDAKLWHVPVGLGFALTIPNPALAIKPWLAPRVDIMASSNSFQRDTRFALSGGIELNFLNGFGLHAAYDRVFVDGAHPSVFAVGAHYVFSVPGL